jgi:hypothetical protein
MRPKLREAYRLLEQYEWAYLTNDETVVDHRGKEGQVLLMNLTTAGALVRRGLATFVDSDDEDREADIISIVKMPTGATV